MTSRPPPHLKPRGGALWRDTIARFVLDPAEQAMLLELCRTVDECDRLCALMRDAEPVVAGSTGQPRAHPLLGEIREHRRVAEALARSLALPVPGQFVGSRRASPSARASADARWRRRGA